MRLAKMFILALWITLCIWAYVEHSYKEKYMIHAPGIAVTIQSEQLGE